MRPGLKQLLDQVPRRELWPKSWGTVSCILIPCVQPVTATRNSQLLRLREIPWNLPPWCHQRHQHPPMASGGKTLVEASNLLACQFWWPPRLSGFVLLEADTRWYYICETLFLLLITFSHCPSHLFSWMLSSLASMSSLCAKKPGVYLCLWGRLIEHNWTLNLWQIADVQSRQPGWSMLKQSFGGHHEHS